ncbi:MAG: TonB-dependent receptor [Bacteroidales bacterium]|nr:TonB-dependent receptor [Bacteroidales bacterium]
MRGGSTDQNLVLLNYAPIINASHFFGFFSAFNSDLITDVTLFKSGMPAKYGGRISSVMEITPIEGNMERIMVSGGISPVTGRIMIDGPIVKEKVSFVLGARTTYSDWILGMLEDNQLQNSTAGFYDLQGTLRADLNDKNSLSLSGYYSNDRFDYYRESGFNYGNLAATLKWKHSFGRRLSAQFFAIMSNYDYRLTSKSDSTEYYYLYYDLNQKIAQG